MELSPQIFAILRELVEQRSGLRYDLDRRDVLAERAALRAEALGFDSLLDYYYYLRYDPGGDEETRRLVDELVVGETYFFREIDQLHVLRDRFIAPWVEEGRRVRIWSAACATGEEPLTMAMLLDERGLLDRCELVATDISTRALERARQGRFGFRALRNGAPERLIDRWLDAGEGPPTLRAGLLERVRFERANLVEEADLLRLGRFDVILCRNVLIYFSDATVRRVLGHLERALGHDGVLAVGVSESLMRYGTAWVCEEKDGVFLYRRRP